MKANTIWRVLGCGVIGALAAAGGAALAQDKPATAAPPALEIKDERAMSLLRGMSDTLAKARSMSFRVRGTVPVTAPTGQYVRLILSSRVVMQRPDKLFVQSRGDLFPSDITFDGKTVTALGADKKFFAQRQAASNTIDGVMQSGEPGADVLAPFLDVIVSDPYAVLTRELLTGFWVGQSTINGVPTDHLAFTTREVDWEVWIGAADKLPRLAVITHRRGERQPTFTVEYSEWKLDAPIPAQTFAATIPKGAVKLEFQLQGAAPAR